MATLPHGPHRGGHSREAGSSDAQSTSREDVPFAGGPGRRCGTQPSPCRPCAAAMHRRARKRCDVISVALRCHRCWLPNTSARALVALFAAQVGALLGVTLRHTTPAGCSGWRRPGFCTAAIYSLAAQSAGRVMQSGTGTRRSQARHDGRHHRSIRVKPRGGERTCGKVQGRRASFSKPDVNRNGTARARRQGINGFRQAGAGFGCVPRQPRHNTRPPIAHCLYT